MMDTDDVNDMLDKAEKRSDLDGDEGKRPFDLGDVTVAIYVLAAVLADLRDVIDEAETDKAPS